MKKISMQARMSSKIMMSIDHNTRKNALHSIADHLRKNTKKIIIENQKDIEEAKLKNLSEAIIDRLQLTEDRINSMINGVLEIAKQPEVVNEFYDEHKNNNGLIIKKQRVPIGVILMIFESRPNVVVDCAALAIKSSNSIILKGGKEAKYSNEILGSIIQDAIDSILPKECVQVIASDKREYVNELLEQKDYIDLVIPRGGEKLIEHVYNTSKIPVIAHFKGLCHIYIDEFADERKAIDIVINAKTQRPAVCNALETLIVHRSKIDLLHKLVQQLKMKDTKIKMDAYFCSLNQFENELEADKDDWSTEYLDNILSIKSADSLMDAIEHIRTYGSYHSEAIITEKEENYRTFLKHIDASCILWNASTRFNDGGQLGLGAELGISTTKIHAYGPMGAKEMTSTRFVVIGDGHIRS